MRLTEEFCGNVLRKNKRMLRDFTHLAALQKIPKVLLFQAGLPDVLQRKGPNVFTNWSKLGPNLQFFWP